MQYEISLKLRFGSKKLRDALYNQCKMLAETSFPEDDGFIEKHDCYHDEIEPKPCIIEEIILVKDLPAAVPFPLTPEAAVDAI